MTLSSELNKRIRIEQRPPALNEMNEKVSGWILFEERWAHIKDLTGREFVAAGGTQNEVTTEIKIRPLVGVTDEMRVVHGTDTYKVEVILRQGSTALLLMSSKGTSNG